MRGEKMRSAVGTDLRGHHALHARAKSYQNSLAWPQFGDAVAPERLHVDEDIRRAFAECEKPEAALPVEPLYDGAFQPARRNHRHVGPRRRHLRRMDSGRLIHGQDAEGLQTLRPLHRLDHDSRPLMGSLESVATQAGHVQQHIGHAVVRDDEPEPLGDIEPFDHTRNLDDRCCRIADQTVERIRFQHETCSWPLGPNCIRRHEDARSRHFWRLFRALREFLSQHTILHDLAKNVFCSRCARNRTFRDTAIGNRQTVEQQNLSALYVPPYGNSTAYCQWAMKGLSVCPMSARMTRSAMSSKSVGSRLRTTRRAPLRFANSGKPAAGHTTRDEPMARNRSQALESASARCMAASGMAWPNEIVAVLI